ncbi:hypothetical protein ABFG93_14210 [Pseudalkalibacillus hwajinpoensis]|uniref:hypothetical protein n=1 Tax=Guptibacillus hwajinpoensis TaxID=208199 RepID=UPI00325AC896
MKWRGIPFRGHTTDQFKETDVFLSLYTYTSIRYVSITHKIAYTSLERWNYEYAEHRVNEMQENRSSPKTVCLDDFALHKGHRFAISLADHKTGDVCQVSKGCSRKTSQKRLNIGHARNQTSL